MFGNLKHVAVLGLGAYAAARWGLPAITKHLPKTWSPTMGLGLITLGFAFVAGKTSGLVSELITGAAAGTGAAAVGFMGVKGAVSGPYEEVDGPTDDWVSGAEEEMFS